MSAQRATMDPTLRRRRIGALIVAVLIAVPSYVLLNRGSGSTISAEDYQRAATDPAAALRVLSHRITSPQQGIEVLYPSGWRGELVNGGVRVTSDDNATGVLVSPRGTAAQATSVLKAAVSGISASLQGAKATYPRRQTPIAGRPAGEAVVTGTRNGARLRILVAVVRGGRVSYVITVLAPPGGGQVGIANLILVRGLTLSG
jgi:hypothetical protein